ncbi:MAG: hypothetical protein E7399_08035 [Ruminococcaceae bacterium]|nr:hypothetical protein [Oscillospiraceae bacterium]
MRDKIIRISWNKALPLENVISSEYSNTQGLYYISRIFGKKETSLYLGIATQHNTIRNRLKSHSWLNQYRGKIYVRLGTVIYPKIVNASIIQHAESAILYEQGDIFFENTDKTKSYTYKELYRIENEGDIFELKPRIRMHEHEEYNSYKERKWNDPRSLLYRWKNDSNPVGTSGKGDPNGKRIGIVKIAEKDREEFLKKKFGLKD